MPPTLVVLAAGAGARFGGAKQLHPVGPGGEPLLDYAVFDAARSGVRRVCFVISPAMAEGFPPWAAARYGGRLEVRCALQRLDECPVEVPAGRTSPWGTAHALLTAAALEDGPVVVVNADDFYGADAISRLVAALDVPPAPPATWHLATWRLQDTLPPAGAVNRALCEMGPDGRLAGLQELIGVSRAGVTAAQREAPVSMNLWGFTPDVFDAASSFLARFFHEADLARDEAFLPDVVTDAIARGVARVELHEAGSRWCGVTRPDDVPAAHDLLAGLHATGAYPAHLWP